MEKYIDRSSIVSLETYETEFITEYHRVCIKPCKIFGIFKIGEPKWVYQSFKKYTPGYVSFDTMEDAFNYLVNGNKKCYFIEGNKIYKKPHLTMTDNNNNTYRKYFDTEKELDKYIESLDLDIVKKYVKIKFD